MNLLRALALLLAAGVPGLAGAQQFPPFSIGADVTDLRVRRDVATSQVLAGPAIGAKATVAFGRIELEGRYAEASLAPDEASIGGPEDYVDARLILHVGVGPGLSIGAGPHLRAFVTPSGTARWSRVEVHARFEGELIAGVAQLRVDAWYAANAESSVQGGGTGAAGGEAGMLIRIPRTITSVFLGYAADRASFANGGAEFVDGVRVSLVVDRMLARGRAPR